MISDKLNKARKFEAEAQHRAAGQKPVYHMSTPIGWMNDPNGFSIFGKEYHLFFQYHPYNTQWDLMYWGHYITKDFICWKLQPCALAPDMEYDAAGCFSGTALEWEGQHVLMYTGVQEILGQDGTKEIRQTQCIAVGDGVNYIKYENNPVIVGDMLPQGSSISDFRDPKLWKDEQGFWSLVGSKDSDESGQLALFHSDNMTEWKFVKILDYCRNEYGKMWECPDFFSLDGKQILIVSPQFMMSDGKEFSNGNHSIYFVGEYDDQTLEWKREIPHMIDFGPDFYAPQTVHAKDGRHVMIGWMQNWDSNVIPDDYCWSGTMTIPRELTLKDERLIQNPVRELENYRVNGSFYHNYEMTAEAGRVNVQGIRGRCMDLSVTLQRTACQNFCIYLAANETFETALRYEKDRGVLTIDRTRCGMCRDMITARSVTLEEEDRECLQMRILVDKNSVEVFVCQGKYVMSMLVYTPDIADEVFFETDGEITMDIEKFDIVVPKDEI